VVVVKRRCNQAESVHCRDASDSLDSVLTALLFGVRGVSARTLERFSVLVQYRIIVISRVYLIRGNSYSREESSD
jgi:hypothetical protein